MRRMSSWSRIFGAFVLSQSPLVIRPVGILSIGEHDFIYGATKSRAKTRTYQRHWLACVGLDSAEFTCALLALFRKSLIINGAGEGNRTLVSGLGSPHSTIEPHPRPVRLFVAAPPN